MRNLTYFVGMSLDGYIAGPNHDIAPFQASPDFWTWLAAEYPETLPAHVWSHFGIAEGTHPAHFDTLIMGRNTYEPAQLAGIDSPYPHMNRQYIVSSTLTAIDAPGVELVNGDPVALVQRLKKEEGQDIWLAGGGNLAAQLMDEIDELVIKSYPVIIGDGTKALAGNYNPTQFQLTDRKSFDNCTQVSWFTRA
ncbi:dihydrofolate reductase family protein [Nocardia inohanensis]|uniref:dihydrofolate reductase family protein n=1 Tax=Nocardia inohanensis TaxID=209246 RepID=UPI00082C2B0A|nr:dihydrofolate reductase family protein [Nocardia inohanensis]